MTERQVRGGPWVTDLVARELRITLGPDAGAVTRVSGTILIGRDPKCDLVVTSEEASRHHARVTLEHGQAFIDDLRSTNGTYVNGERLIARQQLEPGDRVEIASTHIKVIDPTLVITRIRKTPPEVTAVRQLLAHPSTRQAGQVGSRKWWTLMCVCVAVFMLLLDTTIVAVALPSISGSLHTTFSQLEWVVDAYALLLAVVLPTSGAMADVFGTRKVFVAGLTVFTVTSALCGLSPSAPALDVARGVQGIGGAMMFATSLALLAQEFPPAERGIAFGVWGAAAGAATALGPLTGGLLTQALGWQSIFIVNVPIGVAVLYVTLRKLVNAAGDRGPIDWLGFVTLSSALFALVFAVIRGNDEGWTSPLIIALLIGGILALTTFVAVEVRAQHPMLDMALFRKPTFDGASIVGVALQGSYVALILYMTLWLASVLGFSPFQTGLRLLPLFAVGFLVAPIAGRLSAQLPAHWMLGVGMATIAGGLLLMHQINAGSRWTALLPGELLCGFGAGIVNAPLGTAAIAVVPPWKSGMASGLNGTFRQVGMAAGIAAYGAVFQHVVRARVVSALAHTPLARSAVQYANVIVAGGTPALVARAPAADRVALRHAAANAFSTGLADIFLIGALLALLGAAAGFALVRQRDWFAADVESRHAAAV